MIPCSSCDKWNPNHTVELAEATFYFCQECRLSGREASFILECLKAREIVRAGDRL